MTIDDLRVKYAEMLRLRLADDASSAPRRAMAELADRFPGALREIDELPLPVIQSRIEALEAAGLDPSRAEPWMTAVAMFHFLTRGALSAKRWLAGRKAIDVHVAAAFAREADSLRYPDEARSWAADLGRLAAPPRGHITELVFERVARALGVTLDEARHLVFGPPRRASRPRGPRASG